jgi:hypothetical protein
LTKDILTRASQKLMTMNTVDLFLLGLRTYSHLLAFNSVDNEFIEIFKRLEQLLQ